ncbi:NB-ARC domain-containing protein [Streptomyces cucumeris]|uniref:NB-ARC domain-containing protein n=1 Tax=Streptomyces cucumeris TaxID=2962890 RepID=UPI003D70B49D
MIAEITDMLDEASRPPDAPTVAVLTGPGGMGKTATAVRCAYALRERFPDGVLFADLTGASAGTALSPSDVLARFLERLGVPQAAVPGDEARQRDLYRDCTADRRMIIVLDNALDDAQAIALLPASPECLVIVTSRHRPGRLVAEHAAHTITMRPLSTGDSVRLLRRLAERGRSETSDAAIQTVAEATGGVPLALCTTGASLAVREHLTWERAARQLSDQIHGAGQGDTAMYDGEDHASGSRANPVRLVQDVAYGELTAECAAFYRAIAVWAWPTVTVLCAAHCAEVSEDRARAMLEELARVHLLDEVGEERYRFHDMTRAHARGRAIEEDGHGRMAAAVRRTAVAHLRFAAEADFRVMPLRWRLGRAYQGFSLPDGRDPSDGKHALATLRRERENLAAVIQAAAHHGFDDLVWQLCEAMWGLHLLLGFHAQWIDTHLLGVEAARRSVEDLVGDRRAPGRMLTQLAFGYMGLGRGDDAAAALAQAAAADRDCGHHRGEATAIEALGLLHRKQWRYTEAQECFEEAQRILGRIPEGGDGREDVPRATAILEHHIGRTQALQREFTSAFARLNNALALFRQLTGGDPYNVGRVYMSLGEAHMEAGDLDLALVCLDEAIMAMETAGAGLQLADTTELRARCHRLSGRPDREAEELRAAVAHYEDNADRVGRDRVQARLTELGL